MQQFLLFCIMLIVASEAFSKKLHSVQSATGIGRKFSRGTSFAEGLDYPNAECPMAESFDTSIFSEEITKDGNVKNLDFPLRCRSFRRFDRNSFLQRINHFNSRQRSKRKFFKRKKRNTPQFFPELQSSFFGDINSFKYPKQFILSVYPILNGRQFRSKKRTFKSLKNRRVPHLNESQYSIDLKRRNTQKRSANKTCETVTEEPKEQKEEQPTKAPHVDDSYDSLEKYGAGAFLTPHPLAHVPLSRLYNRFLTSPSRPTVPLPKIEFKYPYDPEVYDASLRKESSLTPLYKQELLDVEENSEMSSSPDLKKLKEMVEEVETVLKDKGEKCKDKDEKKQEKGENKKDCDKDEEKEKKKKKKKKKQMNKVEVNQRSLKEKIDCVAIPLLTQISEALGKLPGNGISSISGSSKNENKKCKSKSKASKKSPPGRCSADGTWTSENFGIEMTFSTMPNMMIKVNVSDRKVAAVNSKWSIQGLTLSKNGGPLMLAAVYPQKRQIASFIGQCKTLKNEDIIFGSWTIFTWVQKFTDLWSAVETKLDILKKKKESNK